MQRTFSPYELTQLARAHIPPDTIAATDTRPVEYITGMVDFAGLQFMVTPDVLIPRIESEWLVQRGLTEITQRLETRQGLSVLELGTGSGAISISMAAKLKTAQPVRFVATDISKSALAVAQKNARRLHADTQIRFLHSDLFEALTPQPFDVLIANLPYIPEERIAYLDESVKDHEPFIALSGGESGLELITQMLNQAKAFLAPDGVILLEIDHTHTPEMWQPFKQNWHVSLELDEFSKNRFAVITHQESAA